ncbi:vomeronasal 1 receptor ornAnaV1R3094 [Ornithorhynchus anatinus]|uniref:Vomeronasal type-1 receptor n=1 Tax=Ornithorhynchus anatinus TaxID=9258 RepID=F6YV37_ORNAN|nr:vomeronasal 1 receptor ornAnaV1R3094 [Ornithorhynchus anatinus]
MITSDLVFSIFFFVQTGIGLLGNTTLLLLYVNLFVSQPRRIKPTDLILTHLTVANTVTILMQIAPGMVLAFRREVTVDIVGCQTTLYIRRVARGLSICTTCLLSVFQAITISPSTSLWAKIKPRAPSFILPSFPFFWTLCLLLDINILRTTEVSKNATTTVGGVIRRFCPTSLQASGLNDVAFVSAMTLRDVFFVFLMSWSSGYMVIVLQQHHKRVQHMRNTNLSHKFSPESRATQIILLLVSCYVSFYYANCGVVLLTYVVKDTLRLYDPSTFLGSCFAFICPLILISNDSRLRRGWCAHEMVSNHFLAKAIQNEP